MMKWLRKTLVVVVSALTFGLVTPTLLDSYQDATENKSNKENEIQPKGEVYTSQIEEKTFSSPISERELYLKTFVKDAELHSYEKFGERIKPVI